MATLARHVPPLLEPTDPLPTSPSNSQGLHMAGFPRLEYLIAQYSMVPYVDGPDEGAASWNPTFTAFQRSPWIRCLFL